MDKAIKKQWTEALRSGEYKQGKSLLRSKSCVLNQLDHFCCLGVLTDIYIKSHDEEWIDDDIALEYKFLGQTSILPREVAEWAGISTGERGRPGAWHDGVVAIRPVWGDDFVACSLAAANDNGLSFDEIADIIEKQL